MVLTAEITEEMIAAESIPDHDVVIKNHPALRTEIDWSFEAYYRGEWSRKNATPLNMPKKKTSQ